MPGLGEDADPSPRQRALPPTISICIPAFNESHNLEKLLLFLKDEPCNAGVLQEVLIEVSGSSDGTSAIVSRLKDSWPVVRALTGDQRVGLTAAIARLVEESRGLVIVRMDADIVPERGFLDRLVGATCQDGVGIAGPRVVPLPTGDALCDELARAEYTIHDQVSRLSPKTTVIQAFRRIPILLPTEEGAEDVVIQSAMAGAGLRSEYVDSAHVGILPPAPFGEFFKQRVRTVAQSRSLRLRHNLHSSTQDPRVAFGASLRVLKSQGTSLASAFLFLSIEALAHVAATLGQRVTGVASLSRFEPIGTTKAPNWAWQKASDGTDQSVVPRT